MVQPLHSTLHRTAKYFMDNGRAQTHEEALGLLKSFGLTIVIGPGAACTRDGQIALLTLVNLARRTLLGGIDVVGVLDVEVLVPLALENSLGEAVSRLGGSLSATPRPEWPVALIGDATTPPSEKPVWRLTWEGWRGGVVPNREGWPSGESVCMPLSAVMAAAACAAEAFAFHAGDHPMAGKRAAGLSLWRPGADWTMPDATEPTLGYLPSRLWLIGLGNLGQAYAWLLACLPYAEPAGLELVLQDFDRLAESNDSTSLLSSMDIVGLMKTRWVAEWLEARGFKTLLEERRFGEWTRRASDEPAVALCGVDNALARAALEKAGFELVVESGLGAGPQSFRNFSMHTFPGSRRAEAIWSKNMGSELPEVSHMPAYAKLQKDGLDECGLAQLASRTVGVPFVGLIAGGLVISELLRRLHGGDAFEIVAGSAMALEDIEAVPLAAGPYAFGHVPARRG